MYMKCVERFCEEASIQFHTTCFKCFAKYGVAFKDPDAFHDAGLQPKRIGECYFD
jgi:hypothetical protein